ncbi:putative wsc domain containing protein [Botryosphaeria dothidea]|uniref:Peroxidase n=1 Tax=Botryosphaeria dothidea TaxID=55169 RepID=A0A8H4NAP3_9PEZI|nr:putative wsc domain containing protein [Botryosphaeria dothidea]
MARHPCLTLVWVAGAVCNAIGAAAAAAPTWPSSTDELEDIMVLNTGYRARDFAVPVTPCGFSPEGAGRVQAAEWIRTAFHDMAGGSVYTGIGGLDASIAYETRSLENVGPAFNTTLATYAPYFTSKSSMADLIALGVYTAVRSCGGPVVPIRTGRVDATAAGPQGVPLPQNSLGTFQNQFLRTGFNSTEMIQVVACGHTLGGVHSANNPEIVPVGTTEDEVVKFDTTDAFDNKVVTEYLSNTTKNALVVGPSTSNGRNSDARVFASDKNVTVRALADPGTFNSVCARMMQKMIEVVPSGVVLTDPISIYDVKPSGLQLTLLGGGESIKLTGHIRVRTTERAASQIESVELVYKDRDGVESSATLSTESSGSASGFDDSFEFYGISANIPADSGISAFNVRITLTSGETELHDNNGSGFPLQDTVFFQSPQSCLAGTSMTVTAAVLTTQSAPTLNVTTKVPNSRSVLPSLSAATVAMTKGSSVGPYDLYSATVTLTSAQLDDTRFDVKVGSAIDAFKSSADLGDTCQDLSPAPPATTTTPSSSSTTAAPSSTTAPSLSSTTQPPASSSSAPTSTTTSTTPTTLACPNADGSDWTLAGGQTFTIRCGKDYQAGQIGVTWAASFEACLQACVDTATCEAVAYVGGATTGGQCYLKDQSAGSVDVEGVWGAVLRT